VSAFSATTPTNLTVTRAAAGVLNGQAFTTQPIIQLRNSVNNPVSLATTVTATVDGGATLIGNTSVISSATGAATFTGLGVSGVQGTTYTITYTITSPTVINVTTSVALPIVPPALTPTTQSVIGVVNTQISSTQPLASANFSTTPVITISPALPAGLSIDATTGVISGTPSVTAAQATYTVTATAGSQTATSAVTLVVTAAPTPALTPTTQSFTGVVGTVLSQTATFGQTNFSATPTFTISPTLPAGLSIDATTGVISGTPSVTAAQATYTVTATAGSQTATSAFNLVVNGAGIAPATVGAPASAPSNVQVSAGTLSALVSWGAVTGATRYTAQAYSSPTSRFVVSQCSVSRTSTSCTIPNLQRNLTYYVDVLVRNSAGAVSTLGKVPVTIR
jgi:hypothetical protein